MWHSQRPCAGVRVDSHHIDLEYGRKIDFIMLWIKWIFFCYLIWFGSCSVGRGRCGVSKDILPLTSLALLRQWVLRHQLIFVSEQNQILNATQNNESHTVRLWQKKPANHKTNQSDHLISLFIKSKENFGGWWSEFAYENA